MRIRRIDLTFTALLLPLDVLALLAAAVSAYLLRFSRFVTEVLPILQNVPFNEYISTAALFVIIWILIFALVGLYRTAPRRAWSELGRIIVACAAGTLLTIATVFFRRELTTSRFIVLAVFGFSVIYVWVGRLMLRVVRHELLRAKIGHRRYAVIGMSPAAEGIVNTYKEKPILGVTVVKQFATWNEDTKAYLQKLVDAGNLDNILLANPDLDKTSALDVIAFAEDNHVEFSYLADLFAASFTNISVSTDTGVPIVRVHRTPLDGWGRIAKRTFDVIGAVILLILTSPIWLIAILFAVVEDGIPVIFQNERVGEHGRTFKLYKLRTMWRKYSIGPQFKHSEQDNLKLESELIKQKSIKQGPIYKIADDPRVTPVGAFLRRWSVDELPQLLNVIKGDMSLVGPRPHQPREVAGYTSVARRVFAIRPGVTGLAQISGRSDLTFEDEIRLDAWYIENWSLMLDLYILLKTPFAVLYRKGAY